jgi:nicotinamidase-related amidase
MERLDPPRSLLLIVDAQVRLAAAMPEQAALRLATNTVLLLEAARLLAVPVLATEQYPKGLGPTIESVRAGLARAGVEPIEKMYFDACSEPNLARRLVEVAPRAVVLAGMETHVCVFQTARELVRRGIAVHVVADAVASRREENRTLGLALCERAGAIVTPAETVLFDWLARAGTEQFRALAKLVK